MTDPEPEGDGAEQEAADALEELGRRRFFGESASSDEWRERLGDLHPVLERALEVERALDAAMEAPVREAFPRPFGGYTLLRELGHGSTGIVYEAVHRESGRRVALKLLRAGLDGPEAVERFRREAQACARVVHDHVVRVHEAGEAEGRPFCAMELVPGETLATLLKTGRVPAPRPLCGALAQVADALAAIHCAGIVHRDVKPSNLMVRPDGAMVLTDFGLAKAPGAFTLTQSGDALGTPLYMSPEQVLGARDRLDARTDVYGLGATLWHALAGRPPFEADDSAGLMHAILTRRPADPARFAPGLDPACSRIARKAMEKRSEDRYATASDLRDDLAAFAEGRAVRGRPVPAWRRGVRLLASGRGAALLGSLLLAAAVFGFAGSRWFGRTAPAGPPATFLGTGEIPRIAAARSGTFAAVWEETGRIWTACKGKTSAWEPARRVDASPNRGGTPQVACADDGRVVVVWVEGRGARADGESPSDGVWSATRSAAGAWDAAKRLRATPRGVAAETPAVATAHDGRAVAVWVERSDKGNPVLASVLEEGRWSEPATLDADAGKRPRRDPQVAVGARGEFLGVWASGADVVAAALREGAWALPVRVEEEKNVAYGIRAAVCDDGCAVAVWHQADAARLWHVWANRRDRAGSWGKAELIEVDNRFGNGNPRVGVDASGNAVAVWAQQNALGHHDVWAARSVVGRGWERPVVVDAAEVSAGAPDVFVQSDGRAVAVWEQDDAVVSARYAPTGGWARPVALFGVGQHAQVAGLDDGTAIAVWHLHNRVYAGAVP